MAVPQRSFFYLQKNRQDACSTKKLFLSSEKQAGWLLHKEAFFIFRETGRMAVAQRSFFYLQKNRQDGCCTKKLFLSSEKQPGWLFHKYLLKIDRL
jgi:hypothetical protein